MRKSLIIFITVTAVWVCLLSACAMDSDSWLPVITFFLSFVWLSLFVIANDGWLRRLMCDDKNRRRRKDD